MSGTKSCWDTFTENELKRCGPEPKECEIDFRLLQLCFLTSACTIGSFSAVSGICYAAGGTAWAEIAKDTGIAAAATCGAAQSDITI